MPRGEATDGADFEPMWAVRANAELLSLSWTTTFYLAPAALIGVLSVWDVMIGKGILFGPIVVVVGGFGLVYSFGVKMYGRRIVYIGSLRGICFCYCKNFGDGRAVVKYTSSSLEYRSISSVKAIEFFGKNILTIAQNVEVEPFRFSSLFDRKPKFGATKQYRGIKIDFGPDGIWSRGPQSGMEGRKVEESPLSSFIEQNSSKIGVPEFTLRCISLASGIVCDKSTARFVLGRILEAEAFQGEPVATKT